MYGVYNLLATKKLQLGYHLGILQEKFHNILNKIK